MNRRCVTPLHRWSRRLVAVLVAALLAVLVAPATSASAADGPKLTTPLATLDAALHCPSSFTHPEHEPVLLVHGITSTYDETWGWNYAPALRAAGYDVCGVDVGTRSMGDIQTTTEYVVRAIDRINAATGRKLDVIGHSEGNMLLRWAVKWWPHVRGEVDDMINLAAPNHGITGGNLFCVIPCAPAVHQFAVGSNFLGALNQDDETPGTISYTNLYSTTDEAIVPFTTVPESGAKNIAIQSVCPGRVITHVGMVYDSVTYQLVLDALSHTGAADPGRLPFGKCLGINLPGVSVLDATANTAVIAAHFDSTFLTTPVVWSEPPLKAYALA
ncbi:esterase/lipase family protein [Streptomyces sp. bgisy031]|uniref:esterase/lipase family protein n=1 Tax=Streptomyces sp. bgisy031 TaxID=3413772 RepID=UPI003D707CB0